MSPLALRRYRAERLLRDEFEGLRGRVLANVRARLRSCGVSLDQADLEASYGAAWQGLYTVMLEGQEVANVTGWLAIVTFRRAIEEHRARMRRISDEREPEELAVEGADGRDLASEIDDRRRLQALFEGLRSRLSPREREAATLCYLQGLSRAQAARRMGISEARMRKLMEGQGVGRPGVAGKVGALVQTIQRGEWCESQGSLMRAYAYGILDPDGERHRLAVAHCERCPACRVYVRSLRGLAAVLPPALLPGGLAAGALVHAGLSSAHAAGSAGGGAGASGVAGGGAASAGGAAQAGGAVSATAAAGGAGAGGGWLLAGGSLTGKLAVGCVLALSVGAGCVALSGGPLVHRSAPHSRRAHVAIHDGGPSASAALPGSYLSAAAPSASKPANPSVSQPHATAAAVPPARKASREFGPEQALGGGSSTSSSLGTGTQPTASTASVSGSPSTTSSGGESPSTSSAPRTHASASAAEREFAPG